MQRLTKYNIIIYSILFFLLFFMYINNKIANNYNFAFRFPIFPILISLCFLVIFLSAKYLYKEKIFYFKSIIIPLSFLFVIFLLNLIWLFILDGIDGEWNLLLAIVLMIPPIVTLIVSFIVNTIIYFKIKE